jgi:hypothetical protein
MNKGLLKGSQTSRTLSRNHLLDQFFQRKKPQHPFSKKK